MILSGSYLDDREINQIAHFAEGNEEKYAGKLTLEGETVTISEVEIIESQEIETEEENDADESSVGEMQIEFNLDSLSTFGILAVETSEDSIIEITITEDFVTFDSLFSDYVTDIVSYSKDYTKLQEESYKLIPEDNGENKIKVDYPIYIDSETEVTLDLNGCELWVDNSRNSYSYRTEGVFM